MNWQRPARTMVLLGSVLATACGGDSKDDNGSPGAACTPGSSTGCEGGTVCEAVEGGAPACFAPLVLRGRVFDVTDDGAIAGALVVARDANGAAVSAVATTDNDGSYSLEVPATRLPSGAVAEARVILRADASGYLTFPRAPRVAVPIDLEAATGNPAAVASALTEIGLIPLSDGNNLGSVSGRVLADRPGGALIVAGTQTGVADRDGAYTVFNVPVGSASVEGYLPGVNLESQAVDVKADQALAGVDLSVLSAATSRVSGNVQIVNAPGGSTTSVILVVESTFDETMARGEAPLGLRAANVSGAWSIPNVPAGRYVALAAFENDGLVRDPDTSIGGTEIVHLEVTSGNISLTQGFKVTGALAVESPGSEMPEEVSEPFDLSWEDDSSEDGYDLVVFDALGNETWQKSGIVGPKGNAPVTVAYAGPALEPGMYYQFRATSIKGGVPIAATEDLRGVFVAR